jgi:hypothetical protein
MPVIPATRAAEIKRTVVPDQPWQKVSRPFLTNKNYERNINGGSAVQAGLGIDARPYSKIT